MNKLTTNALFLGALLSLLVLNGTSIAATSSCKGMEASACGASTACSWVDAYKRKDGASVAAHCRTKRGASKHSKVDKLLNKAPS